jgi:hypothetical protein
MITTTVQKSPMSSRQLLFIISGSLMSILSPG